MKTNIIAPIAAALAFALAGAARADALPDPTRPPATLGGAAADGAADGPSLQSIIRSNVGRPAAIISGEYVVLGGRVGDARLVRIGEDSVTLRTATGSETLTLAPGVEKKAVADRRKESDSIRKNRKEVTQ
ncbi:MAG TPA: hypothetical protein VF816_05585 [Rhodocyclaceae bacterium]